MAYIIITAPGCYGTYATIYSRHDTIEQARRALGRNTRSMITTDGGWTDSHQPGMKIHRKDAWAYKRVD